MIDNTTQDLEATIFQKTIFCIGDIYGLLSGEIVILFFVCRDMTRPYRNHFLLKLNSFCVCYRSTSLLAMARRAPFEHQGATQLRDSYLRRLKFRTRGRRGRGGTMICRSPRKASGRELLSRLHSEGLSRGRIRTPLCETSHPDYVSQLMSPLSNDGNQKILDLQPRRCRLEPAGRPTSSTQSGSGRIVTLLPHSKIRTRQFDTFSDACTWDATPFLPGGGAASHTVTRLGPANAADAPAGRHGSSTRSGSRKTVTLLPRPSIRPRLSDNLSGASVWDANPIPHPTNAQLQLPSPFHCCAK